MKTGMLWFEKHHNNDLVSIVSNAADFYERHYGQKPSLCYVHPSAMTTTPVRPGRKMVIRSSKKMSPNHLWIGVDDTPTEYHQTKVIFGINLPQRP